MQTDSFGCLEGEGKQLPPILFERPHIVPYFNTSSKKATEYFCFPSNGKIVSLSFVSIIYISRWGRRTMLYTADSIHSSSYSLRQLMNILPAYFFRIHRSHIISLDYLEGYKNGKVIVNRTSFTLSSSYKGKLLARLQQKIDATIFFIAHER